MKEQRRKKRFTTYLEEKDLQKMTSFCKKNNLKRTEFMKMALDNFIENPNLLLSLAYYSPSHTFWLREETNHYLSSLWDVYSCDFTEILDKILEEENIEYHEYPQMVEKHGFEKIASILIKCISAENNLREKRNIL